MAEGDSEPAGSEVETAGEAGSTAAEEPGIAGTPRAAEIPSHPVPRLLEAAVGRIAGTPGAGSSRTLTTVAADLGRLVAGADERLAAPPATVAELETAAESVVDTAIDTAGAEGLLAADAGDAARAAWRSALTGCVQADIIGRLAPIAVEHGRSLIPRELHGEAVDFAARHVAAARAGHGLDRRWLGESRPMVRRLVDRAWERFVDTDAAPDAVRLEVRPVANLLLRLGMLRLVRIEQWSHEACLIEPQLGPLETWRTRALAAFGRLRHRSPEAPPAPPVVIMGGEGDVTMSGQRVAAVDEPMVPAPAGGTHAATSEPLAIEDLGLVNSIDVLAERVALDGAHVADLGCGSMTFSRLLVERGATVLACDPDPAVADRQAQADAIAGIEFAAAESHAIPAGDASLDGVVFSFSLHHVPAETHEAVLAEVRRVLKPGGFLCVIEPWGGPLNEVMRHFDDEEAVRATAQASLRAHAVPAFENVREFTYHSIIEYASFDDFASRFAGRTESDGFTEADVRRPEVEATFEREGAPDYRFRSPKRMMLLYAPRPGPTSMRP